MCLIALAWRAHPHYDLILAANRDEFHARPAQAAHWWPQTPTLYGGRDLRAGGAWCAASAAGRVAAVTNVRDPAPAAGVRSRGALVHDALLQSRDMQTHADHVAAQQDDYGPFNLLLADDDTLQFVSNRGAQRRLTLTPGVYALSNGHWQEHWPKIDRARDELLRLLSGGTVTAAALFALLAERVSGAGGQVPENDVGPNTEQLLSALFVQGREYGTRSASVILRQRTGHVDFFERGFDRAARITHEQHETWDCA